MQRALAAGRGFTRAAARRSLSSDAALFDGETAELYGRIFNQHYHPQGPWGMMVESAVEKVSSSTSPTLLDIATGPGQPGTLLAQALPAATVTLSDIAPDMITMATDLVAESGVTNAELAVVDAQDMPFADESFNVVTCCYGFMFCPEPEKAFSEVARVLKPGGALITTVWTDLAVMGLMKRIMTALLDEAPPPPPINPMSMAPPGMLEELVSDAGLRVESTAESAYPFDMGAVDPATGEVDDMAFKLIVLPITPSIQNLVESGAKPDAWATARSIVNSALDEGVVARIESDGSILTRPNVFKMLVATKP